MASTPTSCSNGKLEKIGVLTAVGAGEQVVPVGEFDASRRRIADLERLLGRKILENEILKEEVKLEFDCK